MTPIICPTITAYSKEEYDAQIKKVVHLGQRIHIDLTDGEFTSQKSISPEEAWWPVGLQADFHLMYKSPAAVVKTLLGHQPNLVIVQAEAEGDFGWIANFCHHHKVKIGIALLQQTPVEKILPALNLVDHVLVFSGNLGYQGGSTADFSLLDKVKMLRQHKPELEIGWDGGVNDQNVAELVTASVDVLNVGGYIQHASEPERAYKILERIADETGTT